VRKVAGRPTSASDRLLVDAAVAVCATVLAVAQQATSTSQAAGTRSLGLTIAALYPLALVARRLAPVVVMAGLLAGLLVWAALGVPTNAAGIPLIVALYTVAAYRPRRISLAVLAATIVCLGVTGALEAVMALDMIESVALVTAGWWLGDNAHTRRSQSEALAAYAAELAETREELAERRVAEERLRIAREMHDVVAHSLGVVAIQAGVVEHLLDEKPSQARQSVSTIGEVARSSLADMRRTLGVLRGDDDARDASPRLADVPRLVAEVGDSSGLDVRLQVSGTASRPLDPALELSAYRVVQEALTNAGKHAPGSKVTVQVVYGNDDVRVEVADDGAASTPPELPGSGRGLVGMRERVAMFGGTFEAARGDGGGFRVAASFPFAAESP
jgi:signal transduction histidine kinase